MFKIKSRKNCKITQTKIIKLKEPLSPHFKNSLFLFKEKNRNDYFKSGARDF